ncbi:NTP transferase domain-containing protein [Helicobacter sp. 11S02629-2]|uniref:NTP transferase domain-containing protein n=1 Tax=Helicobacter sp. 11S02629-2 TaxID=1476195 RepID=UPI000BA61ACB|nr:NTP transferase domain-containing protein [Helicobacter sp. 11S02629-2]PAF45273.1 hypothetical protein BKH40_03490 [Helicobacter sp. 11S02629-2]
MSTLVILCGGLSSRFGADKSLCEFEKKPLSLYQYERLSEGFKASGIRCKVYLCLKDTTYPLLESKDLESKSINFIVESEVLKKDFLDSITTDTNATTTHIKRSTHSPLYGIYASLLALQTPCVFMSVDTPFLSMATLQKLLDSKKEAFIKTPLRDHFLPSKWELSSLDSIKQSLIKGDYKLGLLLKSLKFEYINIKDEAEFFNMNTEASYKEALKLHAKTKGGTHGR